MSHTSDRLLTTKLKVPPPRLNLVERPRLTERMNDGLQQGHRLFLVSAPAGYGKTTLIVEWFQQLRQSAAWLSLDADDNDPRRFFAYLIAALQQLFPSVGEVASTMLVSSESPSDHALVTSLMNDIADVTTPLFLVLEDYHLITVPAIHEAVGFLLDHHPPQFHLVIATRVDPPLPLARLRVRGLLTEVRIDDLRFTSDEAKAFFSQTMHLSLNTADVNALDERTEGWIAGLQMAALSVRGWDDARVAEFVAAFSGSHHYVIDYLVDEVIKRQSDAVRDFLAQTARLDRLNASLCDAVTGRDDSRSILVGLERADLFLIPLDSQRQWYRYHHLFADALRVELQVDLQQRRDLHKRAAAWFESHGMLRDAIKHALDAETWPEAGRLIKQAASDALDHFELGALRGWLDRLPGDVVLTDPELAILKGWVTYFTGQFAASRAIVQALGDVSPNRLSPRNWARLVSLRATLAVASEDPDISRLIREALALTGEDDPLFRQYNLLTLGLIQQQFESNTLGASETYQEAIRLGRSLSVPAWTMHAVHDLAFTLIKRGRRLEAEALCEAARHDWVDAQGRPFLTGDLLSLPLASSAYDANDLVRARDLALQGFEARQRLLQGNVHGVECEQILIRTCSGLGDWEAAWRFVRRARQVAHTFPWFTRHIARIEADLRLRLGDVEAAERWAETAQVSLSEQPIESRELEYLTYARLLLAQGRAKDAQRVLLRLESNTRNGERYARLISVHILQALTDAALHNPESAHRFLAKAVRLAAPQSYVRRFIDAGPAMAHLLPSVRAAAPAFVDTLQRAFAGSTSAAPVAPVPVSTISNRALPEFLPEPLTEQEFKVLRLLAEGLSYKDIAEQLVISLSTARWHVHNVYAKLATGNRTQAIKRAQELGLL